MVTYDGLFQFCMVIIGIINLVYLIAKKEVTAGSRKDSAITFDDL